MPTSLQAVAHRSSDVVRAKHPKVSSRAQVNPPAPPRADRYRAVADSNPQVFVFPGGFHRDYNSPQHIHREEKMQWNSYQQLLVPVHFHSNV